MINALIVNMADCSNNLQICVLLPSICVAHPCHPSVDSEALTTQRSEPLFCSSTAAVLECVLQTAGMSWGARCSRCPSSRQTPSQTTNYKPVSVTGDRPSSCPRSHTKVPWRLQNEACFKNIPHTQGFLSKQMFWNCDRRDLLELEEIWAVLIKLQ